MKHIRFYLFVDGACRGTVWSQSEDGARRAFITLMPVYPYSDRSRVRISDTEDPS